MGNVVDELVDRLAVSGVATRPAEESDAVDGVVPHAVVAPDDTDGVAAVLRIAAERDLAVVARGAGTKLDWGLPPARLDVLIDMSGLNEIVEHAAGDLVVHVQAGLRLDVLQRALAGSQQRLALDPLTNPGADGPGTIGGVLATAADGPLRLAYGAPRDLIIGITIVRADGVIARAGGKVVKNVAGYDLGKLMTGSWGTLGVITEAVFRLHPLPEASRWIARATPAAAQAARAAVDSQAVPSAVEIDHPPGGETTVAVLVEGGPAGADTRARTIRQILDGGSVRDAAPAWWGSPPWTEGGTALRLTSTLTGLEPLLATFAELPLPAAVRGSAGVGKLHAGFASDADIGVVVNCVRKLRERAPQWGGDVVVLRAPAEVRAALDSWGPVSGLSLMRRIKHEFDPDGRLASGRFVGGI